MTRRIPTTDLFRIGPTGLEPVSDDTIRRKLDVLESATLADLLADPAATLPDCPLSQLEPLEAI